ncbi:MAG: hypothetical protein ABIM40_01855 [Pseudomonadota bacterium]
MRKGFGSLVATLVLVALAAFGATPCRAGGLSEACGDLATQLHQGLGPGAGGLSVAVRPFTADEGEDSLLGVRAGDFLTDALAARAQGAGYSVVEKIRIAEMWADLEEHDLTRNIRADDWLGRLQADVVVTGTCHRDPSTGKLTLSARAARWKTGQVLASGHASASWDPSSRALAAEPPPRTASQAALESLGHGGAGDGLSRLSLYPVGPEGPRPPETRGGLLCLDVGDRVGFAVAPPMDSRLYVINYQHSGEGTEAVFLYPVPGMPPGDFSKGRAYAFPRAAGAGLEGFRVDGPAGRVVFKVVGVCADSGVDLAQGLEATAGYYRLETGDVGSLIKKLAHLPRASWWEESVEFWVRDPDSPDPEKAKPWCPEGAETLSGKGK